jgi:hypothetical protein
VTAAKASAFLVINAVTLKAIFAFCIGTRMVHPTPEMSPPSIKQSPLPCTTFEADAIWKISYISEVRDDLTHSAGRALTFVMVLN